MIDVGSVGGLRIESEFSLHGLVGMDVCDAGAGCIVIRRVSCEELVRRASCDSTAIALDPGQPGSFLVTARNEVLVAPVRGAADRSILSFVFGPCLGVIAYRNGVLPLHASAVGTEHGSVGFVGRSGAGKSTLVAALSLRGHSIHSDDVCMLRNTPSGKLLIWPGIPWIRLSDESVRALDYAPVLPYFTGKKHTLPLKALACPTTPRIPRAVYALEQSAGAEAASVTQLRGSRAAERIIANVYRPNLAHCVNAWPAVVASCVGIANRVPIFLFRRPLDFTQMGTSLDVLEAHMSALSNCPEPS